MSASDASPATQGPIEHVLLDADGVLQEVPGGWHAVLAPYAGERTEELLEGIWADEGPSLTGDGDFLDVLAEHLERHGVATPAGEVYEATWLRIDVDERSIALARSLREAGYGLHLGTNQQRQRGEHMRAVLGYDDLFDVSCYSHEMGVAKPDPAYFTRTAERIGAAPGTILFIDDNAPNITAARQAGLAAERWDLGQGHDVLVALLAAHGVGGVS